MIGLVVYVALATFLFGISALIFKNIRKFLAYSALTTFLFGCGNLIFFIMFYDGSFLDNQAYFRIYSTPKTAAQLVVISKQDFHGDTDEWVGVRASRSQKWRWFSHSFDSVEQKTSKNVGLSATQINQLLKLREEEPLESRELGSWRWQDANLKALLRDWKP